MNDVELKLEELRKAWKEATSDVIRYEIEQEAELYKCCIPVGPEGKKVRCNKPVATLKGVVCTEHLVKDFGPTERKPKTIEEIQQKLNDQTWRNNHKSV